MPKESHCINQRNWTARNPDYGTSYRKANRAKLCKKNKAWTRTLKGYVCETYRRMRRRVEGRHKVCVHLYAGLSLLQKQDFLNWALSDPMYQMLHEQWRLANYDRDLSPSINRIDSSEGYEFGNIEWITNLENRMDGLAHEMELRKTRPHRNWGSYVEQ